MDRNEIQKMNDLMKSLEKDVAELEEINQKLKVITEKKETLEKFYEEKWMDYYEEADESEEGSIEILNQDSLWNVLVDADLNARELIKNAANMI